MQLYTIHLPVKAYIKKYLLRKYGYPLTLSASNVFSDVFLAMLLVPAPVKHSRTLLDQQLGRFDARLDVKIPIDLFYRVPQQPGEHSTVRLNRYFENMFREDFCDQVARMVQYAAIDRQTAIESFAATHGFELETDISFDCLKKMEYRYRKEQEENLKKSMANLSRGNFLFQN